MVKSTPFIFDFRLNHVYGAVGKPQQHTDTPFSSGKTITIAGINQPFNILRGAEARSVTLGFSFFTLADSGLASTFLHDVIECGDSEVAHSSDSLLLSESIGKNLCCSWSIF